MGNARLGASFAAGVVTTLLAGLMIGGRPSMPCGVDQPQAKCVCTSVHSVALEAVPSSQHRRHDTAPTAVALPVVGTSTGDRSCTAVHANLKRFVAYYGRMYNLACETGMVKGCNGQFGKAMRSVYLGFSQRLIQAQPPFLQWPGKYKPRPFPPLGQSMTSAVKMDGIRRALTIVTAKKLPGHFMEAGTWRGGASIFARRVMETIGVEHRMKSFIVDSFSGLPLPRSALSAGEEYYNEEKYLAVAQETVDTNFCAFDVHHGGQVEFFKGFFVDSMPKLRKSLIERNMTLSVARLDGDMYESTIDILYNIYDLIDVGGYVIIDDFGFNRPSPLWKARDAVLDFRRVHGIEDAAHVIMDGSGVASDDTPDGGSAYFVKARQVKLRRDRYPNKVYPDNEPKGLSATKEYYLKMRDKWRSERAALAAQERELLEGFVYPNLE